MKDVVLGELTSFLDHVFICTQRECQTSKDIVDKHRNMFESKISAAATEKLPYSEKLGASISAWSCDMEGQCEEMRGKILRTGEQNNSTKLYKVATRCLDDHQFKEEEKGSVGELSKVCSQFVVKCLYLRASVMNV